MDPTISCVPGGSAGVRAEAGRLPRGRRHGGLVGRRRADPVPYETKRRAVGSAPTGGPRFRRGRRVGRLGRGDGGVDPGRRRRQERRDGRHPTRRGRMEPAAEDLSDPAQRGHLHPARCGRARSESRGRCGRRVDVGQSARRCSARPEANYRPPGGRWGRPVRIGPLDTFLYGLAIDRDAVPSALVKIQAPVGSARRSAARGPMAPHGGPVGRARASDYHLAIGPSGHTVLALEYYTSPRNGSDRYWVEGARLVDGRWTRPVRLSRRANAYAARVGVDGAGVATVTWWNGRGRAQATRWSPGHAPGRPHTLAKAGAGDVAPAVAPNGQTAVVWRSSGRAGNVLVASTRAPSGRWSHPGVISGRRGVGDHQLHGAVGIWPRGRAVVTWPAEREGDGVWISWKR